jgi:hypothetical protein
MIPAARSIAATTLMLILLPALCAPPPAAAQSRAPPPAAASPSPGAKPAATPTTPTPLSAVASSTPQVQLPPAEPQKLVLQAATVAGGPAVARGEGKVAKERPAIFHFQPEAAGLFSIGVASPQNAARITVYLGDSTAPEAGTSQADGAIRWSTGLDGGVKVKIVVHTTGTEIPFRVEVIAGPGSV